MNDASIADILNVYLGQNAGEAVLAGNMSRGKSLKVTAAILIADIRGSTPLLQKLDTDSYIDIINKSPKSKIHNFALPIVIFRLSFVTTSDDAT